MREAMPIRVWLLFFWGCGLRECLFAQSDVSGAVFFTVRTSFPFLYTFAGLIVVLLLNLKL